MEVMASCRINILDGYWKRCLVTAVAVFWGFAAFANSFFREGSILHHADKQCQKLFLVKGAETE